MLYIFKRAYPLLVSCSTIGRNIMSQEQEKLRLSLQLQAGRAILLYMSDIWLDRTDSALRF